MTSAIATAPSMATTQAYADRFEQLAQMHRLWTHPLLARCQARDLNRDEVAILVAQMHYFSSAFNRILASILASCPDAAAQFLIFQNLLCEMGEGAADQAHPELFRRFMRAIGVTDAELATIPALPTTQATIAAYLGLAQAYGYLGALGAVCFASERIMNRLYSQIYQGLQPVVPIDAADMIFFELHTTVEDDYAAQLAELILSRLQTEADAMQVEQAITAAMDARVQFLDGILVAMSAVVPLD